MNVEIVEFYPFPNGKGIVSGTLRVKLSDFGIHVLGIYVTKKGDRWFFNLPGREATHHESGKTIRYPFVVFEDRERHALLMEAIRKQGRAFVEKWLADKEQALEEKKSDKTAQPPITEQKSDTSDSVQKKPSLPEATTAQKKKFGNIATLAKKDYCDPPPRKTSSQKERILAKR